MESGKRRIYSDLERAMLRDISAHIHLTIIENQHLLAGGRKTAKFHKKFEEKLHLKDMKRT